MKYTVILREVGTTKGIGKLLKLNLGSGTCCSRKEDTKDSEEADLRIRILTVLAKGKY